MKWNFRLHSLIHDLFGGLASTLVVLPSAIAFGMIVYSPLAQQLPSYGAIAGMIGVILIATLAPLIGGTPGLISGPSGPAAAVLSAFVTEVVAYKSGNIDIVWISVLIMIVVVMAGLIQLLFGILGGGRLIKYVPYPVIAGYLSAVGLLIFSGQIPNLFGVANQESIFTILSHPSLWHLPSLIVGIVTILTMKLSPRLTRLIPAPILALIAGIITYYVLAIVKFPELLTLKNNHYVIGTLQNDGARRLFSAETLQHWGMAGTAFQADWRIIIVPAITLAVLLSIDTLKSCVVLDTISKRRHNSDRELIGQGIGNMVSGIFGGLAGSGIMGATLINFKSGGSSRISGMLVGIFSLLIFFFLSQYIAWVPIASLGGILFVIGIGMVDFNTLKLTMNRTTLFDFFVIIAVIVTALMSSLIAAAGVGLGLAIFLFLREQILTPVIHDEVFGDHSHSKKKRLQNEMELLEKMGNEIIVVELQGALFFGTTDQLITELSKYYKKVHYIILDFKRVRSIDFTAMHIIEQIEDQMTESGGWLLFANLPLTLSGGKNIFDYFDNFVIGGEKGNIKVFPELDDAMAWAEDDLLDRNGLGPHVSAPPLPLKDIQLFLGLKPAAIKLLEQCAKEMSFNANDVIFRQGERSDEIYLVRKGSVRIMLPMQQGKSKHLATFSRGDFFGDMTFIDNTIRSTDAIAVAPTDLYVISRAAFNHMLIDHPDIKTIVFERLALALARRLRLTDDELSVTD